MLCGMFCRCKKYVVEQEMQKPWNFAKRKMQNTLEVEKNLVLLPSENSGQS